MFRLLTTNELRKRNTDRESFKSLPKLPLYFICDNFHYAWNVGAAFRIADALRVECVYLCGITAFPPHFEIERTGGRAYRWVSWERRNSTADTVMELKERGIQVVAAELAHDSVPLSMHEWNSPAAIVLGSEITGVQQCVLSRCDAVVELPMFGMKNSINVGSTAAVLAYDFFFRGCGGVIPSDEK